MKTGVARRTPRMAGVWGSKATQQTCLTGEDGPAPTERRMLQTTPLMGHRRGRFPCCLAPDLVAAAAVSRGKGIVQSPGICASVASIPSPGRAHLVDGDWLPFPNSHVGVWPQMSTEADPRRLHTVSQQPALIQ